MTAASEPTPADAHAVPTRLHERQISIDALRGYALLCLLPILSQNMAMISTAALNPSVGQPLTDLDGVIWILSHTIFSQTGMNLLALVFGACILLMAARFDSKPVEASALPVAYANFLHRTHLSNFFGRSATALHYRRMLWLLLAGLILYLILGKGAVLIVFAVCGIAIFHAQDLSIRNLFQFGAANLVIGAVLLLGVSAFIGNLLPQSYEQVVATYWLPSADAIARETSAMRGGWAQQIVWRISNLDFALITLGFWVSFFRYLGLMLLGIALLRMRVISGEYPMRRCVLSILFVILVGVPLVLFGIVQNVSHNWELAYRIGLGAQFDYWGSLIISFGHMSLVLLICKWASFGRLKRALAAVGHMALTNGVIATFILSLVYYGQGFGLFGSAARLIVLEVAMALAIGLLVFSRFWLSYFRFGPFEWLWRTFSYRTKLGFVMIDRMLA